jgi:glutamate/tyrosine decarboxylase-like PLP-dependent enzyme
MNQNVASVQAAIKAAFEAAVRYAEGVDTRRVAPNKTALDQLSLLSGDIPNHPVDPVKVIEQLDLYGSPATVASTGGRYFGLVVGGTLPAALGARILASSWDQVVFNDGTSPVGCALERVAGRWVLDVLGLPQQAYVSFVTGATMASFTCLAAAREYLLLRAGHSVNELGMRGAPRIRIVVSSEIHVTVLKALKLLGIGEADIERVPTDSQGRIETANLPELDDMTILCTQAGNVNSGACDGFTEIAAKARAAKSWLHVDGAFGLWAAASSARRHLVEDVEQADSWVTDGHKWLNTPYDCGIAIVRHSDALHNAMATQAPYLHSGQLIAPKDMGPEFSRSARGVEVWAGLMSLGRQGLSNLIDQSCASAKQLADGLRDTGYEVINDVVLNQVVAKIGTAEQHAQIARLAQESGDCWFGVTNWKGRSALRLSVSSWKTSEADIHQTLSAIKTATKTTMT